MVTRLPDPEITPTSQEGGGMMYDSKAAMTAPGSSPVTPLRTPWGGDLPFPAPEVLDDTQDVPLSGQHARTAGNPAPSDQGSGGGWVNTDDIKDLGRWRNM